MSEFVDKIVNPLPKEGLFIEGNMVNISKTIPINVSTKPGIMENVYIGANSSPEEIAIYTTHFK